MREMKDSGIEWIGNIPNGWHIEKGKYCFTNKKEIPGIYSGKYKRLSLTLRGVVDRSKEDAEGLQPKDFNTYQLLRENELVFKLIDLQNISTSRVGLSYSTGLVSPAYIILCANEKIVPSYAEKFYLMMWHRKIFNMLGDNGVRSNLGVSDLLNVFVSVPPICEQKMIADFLDSKCSEIDAISADIQKEIEILEQYKRSVITEAVTKGLDQDAEMKDSGVAWCPQIPSNWQYTNPKGLFGLRTDRAFRNDRQLTASQEYGIVYQDEYMEKTGNKVVTVTKDFSILKHVEPDDFVISMRSFQGGLEYSDKRGCISSAYVMLIPNKEFVYAPFYRWFFKSSKYINALQSTSNLVRDGQAMRYANFVKVPLFIVPIEEQKAIASYLDEKIEKVNSILAEKKKQLEILSNYKKSLIYEYVTGKKEVLI